jgi:hypothetical protein
MFFKAFFWTKVWVEDVFLLLKLGVTLMDNPKNKKLEVLSL